MEYRGTPLENTMMELLDVSVIEMKPDKVVLRMPVGPKVHQPHGLLHGGASVVLAETAASLGATLHIDPDAQWAVGQEINANHVRSVRAGSVTAEATPLYRGRSSMVWDIRIRDEAGELVCVSRCTMAIIPWRG